jgi:hypothetical protein
MIYEIWESDGDRHFYSIPPTTPVYIQHTKDGILRFECYNDASNPMKAIIEDCLEVRIGTDSGALVKTFAKGKTK